MSHTSKVLSFLSGAMLFSLLAGCATNENSPGCVRWGEAREKILDTSAGSRKDYFKYMERPCVEWRHESGAGAPKAVAFAQPTKDQPHALLRLRLYNSTEDLISVDIHIDDRAAASIQATSSPYGSPNPKAEVAIRVPPGTRKVGAHLEKTQTRIDATNVSRDSKYFDIVFEEGAEQILFVDASWSIPRMHTYRKDSADSTEHESRWNKAGTGQ
jgi:hypothetical protein